MGIGAGGGGGGGQMYPPMSAPQLAQPTPAELPAPPPPAPTTVDPAVQRARDEAKRRAGAMAGYASTITTSGLGVLTPANTTAGQKTSLGA